MATCFDINYLKIVKFSWLPQYVQQPRYLCAGSHDELFIQNFLFSFSSNLYANQIFYHHKMLFQSRLPHTVLVHKSEKCENCKCKNPLTISASSSSRSSKSSATLLAPPSLPPLLRFKLLAGVVGKPVSAHNKIRYCVLDMLKAKSKFSSRLHVIKKFSRS
jgi:hypothetical protein